MSLFALRREYQRSTERVWQDFSGNLRTQTESAPGDNKSTHHRSVLDLNSQREGVERRNARTVITSQPADGPGFIQHDVKAWARFLDGQRRG